MSNRALEAGLKRYPENIVGTTKRLLEVNTPVDINLQKRIIFIEGYKQAKEDIINLIESRISEILGDAQPSPILRHELQYVINKIKEDE